MVESRSSTSPSPSPMSPEATTSAVAGHPVSDVWKFFRELKDIRKAECTICLKHLAYHGGTSNLREHLLKVHPLSSTRKQNDVDGETNTQSKSSKQLTMDSLMKAKVCSSSRSKDITDKIIRMIVLDMRPICTVECVGFRDMISLLEPGYVMPSRKSVKKMIHHLHEQGKLKLSDILSKASAVALTTDIWTSSSNDAYITVSAHWISSSWEAMCCVLETKEFPGRHTGAAISYKLIEIIGAFKIGAKESAIVHDQASNMELSLRILEDSRGYESLACNAHKLQLCVKAGLAIDRIDRLLHCASKLVGHFRHSALATGELTKRQLQMNVKQKKLIQSCSTRWNSSYYMLERLIEMRWPVSAVLSDENVTKRSDRGLDLSNEQWTLAEELVNVLQPFEVATTLLCSEYKSSISTTLPVVYGLTQLLEACDDDSTQFKVLVLGEIQERWELESLDVSSCMVISSLLDPRFKPIKFLDELKLEAAKLELIDRLKQLPDPIVIEEESIPPSKKSKTAMDILFGEEGNKEDISCSDPVNEVTQFFAEKAMPKKSSVLSWWKNNSTRYKRLAVIAKHHLAIPST